MCTHCGPVKAAVNRTQDPFTHWVTETESCLTVLRAPDDFRVKMVKAEMTYPGGLGC